MLLPPEAAAAAAPFLRPGVGGAADAAGGVSGIPKSLPPLLTSFSFLSKNPLMLVCVILLPPPQGEDKEINFVILLLFYRVTHHLDSYILLTSKQKFPRLVGRYCR